MARKKALRQQHNYEWHEYTRINASRRPPKKRVRRRLSRGGLGATSAKRIRHTFAGIVIRRTCPACAACTELVEANLPASSTPPELVGGCRNVKGCTQADEGSTAASDHPRVVNLQVSIPERQHVSPQRGTEAANDASTPLGMTCTATNANPRQPGFRFMGQTGTKSPIEPTFRTSIARIPRFLDNTDFGCSLVFRQALCINAQEDITPWAFTM